MQRASGIDGIFLHAARPDELAEWYFTHLGIDPQLGGFGEQAAERAPRLVPAFRALPADPENPEAVCSISFTVPNLEAMLRQLHQARVDVTPAYHDSEGSYATLRDPEGNLLRLREPLPSSRPEGGRHTYSMAALPLAGRESANQSVAARHRLAQWLPVALIAVLALLVIVLS